MSTEDGEREEEKVARGGACIVREKRKASRLQTGESYCVREPWNRWVFSMDIDKPHRAYNRNNRLQSWLQATENTDRPYYKPPIGR